MKLSWWTFRIFFFVFSAQGGGRGSSRRQERGGDRFFLEDPWRGGGLQEGEGLMGREGVCGELGFFWGGGGLNIFFSGQNVHQGIICKLFSGSQLQLAGVFRINLQYSCSFLVFLAECSYRN